MALFRTEIFSVPEDSISKSGNALKIYRYQKSAESNLSEQTA